MSDTIAIAPPALAMQYSFTLPADYDMAIVERASPKKARRSTAGGACAPRPTCPPAATLTQRENLYAPFYVLDDAAAMSGFLNGRGFAGVSDAFGWPEVRTWIVWRAALAPDLEQARFATREIAPIEPHAALDELEAQENEAVDEAVDRGALAAVAGFEPTRWTRVRFRMWRGRPGRRDGVALYDVGHVSLGRPSVAAKKRYRAPRGRRGASCDEERTLAEVAFLGLGVMGYPMAGHLKGRGGHDVVVYNRTAARSDVWVAQHGGAFAPTPREAAHGRAIVFACVGNDDDLRAVTLGPTAPSPACEGRDLRRPHHRFGQRGARTRAEAQQRGLGFVDAPVSGGQAGAENGALTVMCGGDEATSAKVEGFDGRLRPRLQIDGAGRLGPARQDGQPDPHRRARPGPRRGPALRQARRPRRRTGWSTSSPRARRNRGRWTIVTRR